MSTKMRMLKTMIVFFNFCDIGISKPAGGKLSMHSFLHRRKKLSED